MWMHFCLPHKPQCLYGVTIRVKNVNENSSEGNPLKKHKQETQFFRIRFWKVFTLSFCDMSGICLQLPIFQIDDTYGVLGIIFAALYILDWQHLWCTRDYFCSFLYSRLTTLVMYQGLFLQLFIFSTDNTCDVPGIIFAALYILNWQHLWCTRDYFCISLYSWLITFVMYWGLFL
jgi:hypothetical protein